MLNNQDEGQSTKPINYKGPMEELLGRYVKTAFPTEDRHYRNEHMWVKITSTKGQYLLGTLVNKPRHTGKIKYGDLIAVTREGIEAIA
jgi:uncharacterized protein YegJ (DUF2314 family)